MKLSTKARFRSAAAQPAAAASESQTLHWLPPTSGDPFAKPQGKELQSIDRALSREKRSTFHASG